MSIENTLEIALRDYMKEHEDSSNPKPNRILMSPSAYEDYEEERGHSEQDNISLRKDGIVIVKKENQAEPIILEKRSIHE